MSGLDSIRAIVAGARIMDGFDLLPEPAPVAPPPVRPVAPPVGARTIPVARASGGRRRVKVADAIAANDKDKDKKEAARIWEDCVPLQKGVPAGIAYVARFVGEERLIFAWPRVKRLRVGVMPWLHRDRSGRQHDLGRHPCLIAAFGRGKPKAIMGVWLEPDGSDLARIADPDDPGRALSAHWYLGEADGQAIQFGEAGEGMTVAVTLECALTILLDAPGPVWAVPDLAAARKVDVPAGLSGLYLALWRLKVSPARRENEIMRAGWHLSARHARALRRADIALPWAWSPAPGKPRVLIEQLDMEAAISAWESEGGR